MEDFQELFYEILKLRVLVWFQVAFAHLLPLLGLHHRKVVVAFDTGNLVHDLEAFGQQLAELCVHVFKQGALLDEFMVGYIGLET